MKKLLMLLSIVCALALTGCANVPVYEENTAVDTYAKSIPTPPQGYAGLYLIREKQFKGSALEKRLYIDGRYIGKTMSGTFFYRLLRPGMHTVLTHSQLSNIGFKGIFDEGKNYFYSQDMTFGFFVGGSELNPITEEQAKKLLINCTRAVDIEDKDEDLDVADYSEGKGSIPGPLTADSQI